MSSNRAPCNARSARFYRMVNELPALALATGLFLVLLWRSPGKTLLLFIPAALVPLAALAGTNYLALGQLRPAYSEFGGPWYQYEGSHWRVAPASAVRAGQRCRHRWLFVFDAW